MTEQNAELKEKEYPEILVEIGDFVAEFMVGKGISDLDAAKAGLECAERIRKAFGGEMIYMPKGMKHELSQRDLSILDRFDGANYQEICREHGITRRRLYQILHAGMKGRQRILDFGVADKAEGDCNE